MMVEQYRNIIDFNDMRREIVELMQDDKHRTRNEICEYFGYKQRIEYTQISHTINGDISKHYHVKQYEKRTTIHDNIQALIDCGILEKYSKQTAGKRGRPPVYYKKGIKWDDMVGNDE